MPLASFTVKRTYCKLVATMHVDCERRESTVSLTYDRLLVRVNHPAPYRDTSTPEAAEAWLTRSAGERGSLMETLEADCRLGILKPETAEVAEA